MAVKTAEVATPEPLVAAVTAPPAKVPPAPLEGAEKVTATPLTGLPPASLTSADKGLAKAVLTDALCGVPPAGTTEEAEPAVPALTVTLAFVDP